MKQANAIRPTWYLLIGIITLSAAHLTYGIDIFGWVACAPFLIYLDLTRGVKSRLLFTLALAIAWSVAVFKIITPPIPFAMIFLFSIPITLFHLPGYLLRDRYRKHEWSILLFPATMVLMEWIQYTFTPFASWGVAAYTQSNNIDLMQAISIFGLPGLSFLIYWVNASIAEIAVHRKFTLLSFYLPISVLVALMVFGSLRYNISKSAGKEMVVVAAVGTDSDVSGLPLPSKESNEKVKRALFERTGIAAKGGAELVVWNEAAIFVLPEEESAWKDSLAVLAKTCRVHLVAAYVKPVSQAPLKYENKYLLLDSNGTILYTYQKHEPVPGEPTQKGQEPLAVVDVAGSNIGGAICYDYDFPYLAKGFRRLNADIVALPSSDWRGIDPVHTKMAAFRAIEQGHSVLRSTRFGLSAAISPYGEFTAQMSSFDEHNKIMMAQLPKKAIATIYSVVGDVFIYLCMGFVVFFLGNKKSLHS